MVQFLFNNVITIISQPQDVDLVILSTRLLSCNLDRFKHDALFSFGYNHPLFFLLRTPSQLQCILNIQPQDVDLVISTRLPNRNLDMTFYFPLVTRPPPPPLFFFLSQYIFHLNSSVYLYTYSDSIIETNIYQLHITCNYLFSFGYKQTPLSLAHTSSYLLCIHDVLFSSDYKQYPPFMF